MITLKLKAGTDVWVKSADGRNWWAGNMGQDGEIETDCEIIDGRYYIGTYGPEKMILKVDLGKVTI